jgi:LysR family glycine cleavage system transcriptional activator
MAARIPPLNPLRVFEVVARTLSLTVAAQELHVTQSAVSRQIAVLENYLEKQLFRRERDGVTLTRLGGIYAAQIVPAFEEIARATEALAKCDTRVDVRVRTHTTFAAKWLIPHLPEFQTLHPKIKVHVINALPDVDFEFDHDPVDMSIQLGDGRWPKVHAEFLFRDEIEPVCSPVYLARFAVDVTHPEALLAHRLLVSRNRAEDWDDWLAATGLTPCAASAERMTFSISMLTWQAAIDGLGMAIGQLPHLSRDLATGALVRPFGRPVARDVSYYLVGPELHEESRAAATFREWLLARIRAELAQTISTATINIVSRPVQSKPARPKTRAASSATV